MTSSFFYSAARQLLIWKEFIWFSLEEKERDDRKAEAALEKVIHADHSIYLPLSISYITT